MTSVLGKRKVGGTNNEGECTDCCETNGGSGDPVDLQTAYDNGEEINLAPAPTPIKLLLADEPGNVALQITETGGSTETTSLFPASIVMEGDDPVIELTQDSINNPTGIASLTFADSIGKVGEIRYDGTADNIIVSASGNRHIVKETAGGAERTPVLAVAPTINIEDGMIYYNSTSGQHFARQSGAWTAFPAASGAGIIANTFGSRTVSSFPIGAGGAWITAVYNTKEYDNPGGSNYNTTTGIYTVPSDGTYTISMTMNITTAAGGDVEARIFYNNSVNLAGAHQKFDVASTRMLNCSTTYVMSAGDNIRFQVSQLTGFSATLEATSAIGATTFSFVGHS
jgi:hypothetical protein